MPNKQETTDTGTWTEVETEKEERPVKRKHNSKDTLPSALAKAQMELKKAAKSASNPYFKSKYAGLDDVIEACRNVLNSHGIAVTQTVEYLSERTTTDTVLPEVTHHPRETFLVTTLLYGEQSIRSVMPLEYKKADMQSLGSAITYARRYSLQGICCLATDEPDDDANAAVGTEAMDKKAPYKKRGNSEPKVEATAGDFLK